MYTRALWMPAWDRGRVGNNAIRLVSDGDFENQTTGDQATKGNRWMPWGREPTKGVAHDDTPRGAASRL